MCTVPQLTDLDLTDIDIVAIDLETYDPNLKTKGLVHRIQEVIDTLDRATDQVMIESKFIEVSNGDLSDIGVDWAYLNEKYFKTIIRKVFHNAMYDVCWIRSATGDMPQGALLDTMIAASVIDETRMKYSLDSISKDYLKESKYKYDMAAKVLDWSKGTIKDPMTSMHKLPYHLVKDYAEQDTNLTLKLWELFEKKYLDAVLYTKTNPDGSKEYKTCRKIFELETKLFPCLVDMKFKGVKIDVEKAKAFGKLLEKRRDNLLKIIKKHTKLK